MMKTYDIHPLPDGVRCVLIGPLGAVDRLELDSIREAALHAQACALGNEALLRVFNLDGTLKNERAIPERVSGLTNSSFRQQWF